MGVIGWCIIGSLGKGQQELGVQNSKFYQYSKWNED